MDKIKEQKQNAKFLMGAGLGVGAYGTTLAVTIGYVCPFCVIAAPTLIGYGIYKHSKAKQNSKTNPQ